MAETEVKKPVEKKTTAPKAKMVKIKIPKTRERTDDVFVSVNDRTWQIQRGIEVEVPMCVYKQLVHAERMEELGLQFIEEATAVKTHM